MKRPFSGCDAGAGTTAPPTPSELERGVAAETVPNTGSPGIFLAGLKSADELSLRRRSMSVPATMPEVAAHDSEASDFNRILTSVFRMTRDTPLVLLFPLARYS